MSSSPYIYCPKCQSQNNRGEQACFACGRPLTVTAFPAQQKARRVTAPPPKNMGERIRAWAWKIARVVFAMNGGGVTFKRYTEDELRSEQWEKEKRRNHGDTY